MRTELGYGEVSGYEGFRVRASPCAGLRYMAAPIQLRIRAVPPLAVPRTPSPVATSLPQRPASARSGSSGGRPTPRDLQEGPRSHRLHLAEVRSRRCCLLGLGVRRTWSGYTPGRVPAVGAHALKWVNFLLAAKSVR